MTMDWESWLRGETSPSLKQDESSGKNNGASQAELLGLPVVPPEKMEASPADEAEAEKILAEESPHETSAVSPDTGEFPVERLQDATKDSLEEDSSPPADGEIEDHRMLSADDRLSSSIIDFSSEEFAVAPLGEKVSNIHLDEQTQSVDFSVSSDTEPVREASALSEFQTVEISKKPVVLSSDPDEIEHEENFVPTFTIPAQPLYPLPVSSAPQELSRVKESVRSDTPTPKKIKALPVFIITAILVLGGLFFTPGESFEEILQKGEDSYIRSEYDKALAYYNKAVKKDPHRIEGLFGVALTLESMGRKGEAVDAWYRCLQIAPNNAAVYAHLGDLLVKLGSLDTAIRNYQDSIRLEATNADVHAALGKAFEARGEFGQAVDAYRNALAIDNERSDLAEALLIAEKELEVRETERQEKAALADEQMRLGVAALGSQDYSIAEGHFLRALDLIPEIEDAFLGLADAKLGKGDTDGAKEVYRKLLSFHPLSGKGNEALRALELTVEDEDALLTSPVPEIIPSPVETPTSNEALHATTGERQSGETADRPEETPAPTPFDRPMPDDRKSSVAEERLVSETTVYPDEIVTPTPSDKVMSDEGMHAVLEERSEVKAPSSPEESFVSTLSPVEHATPTPVAPDSSSDVADIMTPVVSTPETLVSPKIRPRQEAASTQRPREEQRTRTTRAVSAAPSRRPQDRRESLYAVAALTKNEQNLLSESRSLNLSGEYPRAAEKASEALSIQQSPEALSNLGFAHIGLGNYPAAFTAYWRRLLLSSEIRNSSLEPPAFLTLPFEAGRWKEMPTPDPRDLPLTVRADALTLLPGDNYAFNRVLAGKEYLFEALRLNPRGKDVYLNLSLSYLLMRNQESNNISFHPSSKEAINENALYLALLAHALRVRNDEERSLHFLNAAALRASGEVLRVIHSLERLLASGIGR